MNRFTKVVRANANHISRFHTERGELMPRSAWLELIESVIRRAASKPRQGPWMVPSAVSYLDRIMSPTWRVFEFGSGSSTPWLARRSKSVISLEHNPLWHERVTESLRSQGLTNASVYLVALEAFPKVIEEENDDSVALVIVDGSEHDRAGRIDCIAAARAKVESGGYLVLDDSDRTKWRGADEMLSGWSRRRFVGVKEWPLMAVETTIYRRP